MHSSNALRRARPDFMLLGAKIFVGLVLFGPVLLGYAVSQTPTRRVRTPPVAVRITGGKITFPSQLDKLTRSLTSVRRTNI
jgi:hypothetical protein